MYITTQGLILRETQYKDADKILTVFTQDFGKQTVKARGCRRKNSKLAASAQLLVYSDMTLWERRSFLTLHEASTRAQFWGIRQDIVLLALASYFSSVTDSVTEEGVSQPDLLSLLLNAMYALDQLKKPPALVKAVFELRLLCLIGYEPLLDACIVCGKPNPQKPYLHLTAGGLHCATCQVQMEYGHSMPLTSSALAAMRYIASAEAKRLFSFTIEGESLRLLGEATEAFLCAQLDRSFHTLTFYKQLIVREG